ncbi:MAG: hypothetical protein E6J20_18690 [Chloroflexi bacterium]|nr:MAG: hypothetical protein E6J20_18690 [Chloroflexota bacterium]
MKDNLFANRTLWLDREHMDVARGRFYEAWRATVEGQNELNDNATRRQWNIAWAAGIAAYSFCAEGNLGPRASDRGDGG